jgi:hypothetical protein
MVKILSALFKGSFAMIIKKVVNSDLPGVGKYFTGFIAILVFKKIYHLALISINLKKIILKLIYAYICSLVVF